MLWMVLRQPLLNVADGALERDVEAERRVLVMRTLDHQRHFVGVHRYDRSREDGQAEKLLSWQSRRKKVLVNKVHRDFAGRS